MLSVFRFILFFWFLLMWLVSLITLVERGIGALLFGLVGSIFGVASCYCEAIGCWCCHR